MDAWIICPFFLQGGRYTIGDTHYVADSDRYLSNLTYISCLDLPEITNYVFLSIGLFPQVKQNLLKMLHLDTNLPTSVRSSLACF